MTGTNSKTSEEELPVWEKHPLLYHYTTTSGLLGIWESQSLWATHFRSLNDTSEIHLMERRLVDLVRPGAVEAVRRLGRVHSRKKISRKPFTNTVESNLLRTMTLKLLSNQFIKLHLGKTVRTLSLIHLSCLFVAMVKVMNMSKIMVY